MISVLALNPRERAALLVKHGQSRLRLEHRISGREIQFKVIEHGFLLH